MWSVLHAPGWSILLLLRYHLNRWSAKGHVFIRFAIGIFGGTSTDANDSPGLNNEAIRKTPSMRFNPDVLHSSLPTSTRTTTSSYDKDDFNFDPVRRNRVIKLNSLQFSVLFPIRLTDSYCYLWVLPKKQILHSTTHRLCKTLTQNK